MMTRDMDLIRKIIVQIQSWKDADLHSIEIDGYDSGVIARHLELLSDAGFIVAQVSHPVNDLPRFIVKDVTWDGHDFAAVISNETVWSKIRNSVSATELAKLPLTVIKNVGLTLLEQSLKSMVGL